MLLMTLPVAVACGPGGPTPDSTLVPPATAQSGTGDQHGADVEHTDAGVEASRPPVEDPAASRVETAWGPIWDRTPAGFPVHPEALPGDAPAGEPVSLAYTVEPADPADLATWLQAALEGATYSTEALSGPLDDGGFVIDSVGDGECRIEVTLTPREAATDVTVRYGADCPIDD